LLRELSFCKTQELELEPNGERIEMAKRDKSKKLGPVEVLVLAIVCLLVLAVFSPVARRSRFYALRNQCKKNLSEIGNAMLAYANDYNGIFPRSGGINCVWTATIPDWKAADRYGAFGLLENGAGGQGNISSCFYLLVKYMNASPKIFVCPSDAGTTEFKLADVDAGDKKLPDLWDFGPEPGSHSSYSYHMPFGLYALTTSSPPGMAVAADRNPWLDSPAAIAKRYPGNFNPNGSRKVVKYGNAVAHEEEGQNVLFVDGHVSFENKAFCGVDNDNIYTYWDGGDIRIGANPLIGIGPMDRSDSLLVNDPGAFKTITIKHSRQVNSADLKQTCIVATLDCPMTEHKNIIWCGTFQIAWDKFKNDIIGEPIKLIGAKDLDDRLNNNEFSTENLVPGSYYAVAGFVKDGIIEQIQKEMAKRFPSETTPVFDKRYRTLPEVSMAYAFLSVDAGFKYPFNTNTRKFSFKDSEGIRTYVTSFSDKSEGPNPDSRNVREQVEVLYYEYSDQGGDDKFAVDLCKYTDTYQVVLVRMYPRETLAETLIEVQKKILEFKQDQNYEALRKLRPIDSLIVPDVLYKLTHHFTELEHKDFANTKWKGYFVFDAMQMVDFSLSRTGVILKSEARMAAGGVGPPPPRIEKPRHFHFDRPFLIYVKKRGPDYSPFFVMWVDNAELLEKFQDSLILSNESK
jgi:prepilin-type processing-associated H-X9-DG protein